MDRLGLLFLMERLPPESTGTDKLFPSTTLCRSLRIVGGSLYADRARLDCPGRCGLGPRADDVKKLVQGKVALRSEEHTSELQSLMRNSYAVFCLKKKNPLETKENKPQTRHRQSKHDYEKNVHNDTNKRNNP